MSARLAKHTAYWVLLVSPGLLPLLWVYLPFQDWPGHVGILGVITHWGDPGTEYYAWRSHLGPNRLLYLVAWPLAEVFSPLFALRIVLAISLAALAPSVHFLLRVLGRNSHLAIAAVPLALGRHLLSGFATTSGALPTLVLALAFFFLLRRTGAWRHALALAVLNLATAGFHAFIWCVLMGLLALGAGWELVRRETRAALMTLGAAGLALVVLPLMAFATANPDRSGGTAAAIMAAIRAPSVTAAAVAWEWIFAGLRYSSVDDFFQAAWCLALLASFCISCRGPKKPSRLLETPILLAWVASTFVVFLFLGENIGPPVDWWGGSLRLPVVAALLVMCIAAPTESEDQAAAGAARLEQVLAVWLALVAIGFSALLHFQVARFSTETMAGLSEVIDAAPPGRRLCPLHTATRALNEFPGEPQGYVGNYYVAAKMGVGPQGMFGNPGVVAKQLLRLQSPGWGRMEGLSGVDQLADCDLVLLELHQEPSVRAQELIRGSFVAWAESGHWRVLQRR